MLFFNCLFQVAMNFKFSTKLKIEQSWKISMNSNFINFSSTNPLQKWMFFEMNLLRKFQNALAKLQLKTLKCSILKSSLNILKQTDIQVSYQIFKNLMQHVQLLTWIDVLSSRSMISQSKIFWVQLKIFQDFYFLSWAFLRVLELDLIC